MRIRYVELEKFTEEIAKCLAAWTAGLGFEVDRSHSALPNGLKWGSALRVMWSGDPFFLAGRQETLTKYLNELDCHTARLLKDCAYFWLLSDVSEYFHSNLPNTRIVTLDWAAPGQRKVRDAIQRLAWFPRLKGLSESMDRLRREIKRIALERTGPGCSVLILGPSGCGKEEVAQSLVGASSRAAEGIQAVSGAWLNLEPGMAMTELVGLKRGTKFEPCDGLLKHATNRALFIDDFESAPQIIQEVLLRVMAVPEGERAPYRPVGAIRDEETNVWLMFATNKPLKDFVGKGMRVDVLYRFGTRVISILPLEQRPADLPAIAHAAWSSIWDGIPGDERREPLRSDALRSLVAKEVDWDGNVRILVSILKLVVAGMRDLSLNGFSQADIIDLITSRGRTYLEMVVAQQERKLVVPAGIEEQICEADFGHPRFLGPSVKGDPDEQRLTASEAAAKAALTPDGWKSFSEIVGSAPPTKSPRVIRVSVRLARIVWYLSQRLVISVDDAARITRYQGETSVSGDRADANKNETTARKDLEHLARDPMALIRVVKDSSKAYRYEKITKNFL